MSFLFYFIKANKSIIWAINYNFIDLKVPTGTSKNILKWEHYYMSFSCDSQAGWFFSPEERSSVSGDILSGHKLSVWTLKETTTTTE